MMGIVGCGCCGSLLHRGSIRVGRSRWTWWWEWRDAHPRHLIANTEGVMLAMVVDERWMDGDACRIEKGGSDVKCTQLAPLRRVDPCAKSSQNPNLERLSSSSSLSVFRLKPTHDSRSSIGRQGDCCAFCCSASKVDGHTFLSGNGFNFKIRT